MKIKNYLLILLASGIVASCGKTTYRKTPGGMPYKVYSTSDTQKIYQGDFLKVHFTRKIKDSVDFTTMESMPVYIPVPAETTPYDLSEIWTKLKKGDSVIATQMMDTFIKRNPQHPSFVSGQYKKGDKITVIVKILDVFTTDSAFTADEILERKLWEERESETLAKYLKDNNINAQKTVSGAFVEIINPGVGDIIDSGKYIYVNYTGTSFSGKKFDSNTDSAFQHVQPLTFTVASGEMIKGFDEGVRFLRKEGKAKFYIPSSLGYGGQPNPNSGIKPYESLIFDIEILDVKDKAPASPEANDMQRRKKVE